VLYGYVYYKLGLILTSFMIGLVLGSGCINHMMDHLSNDRMTYIKTQVAICMYPLLLLGILYGLAQLGKTASLLGIPTAFAFLPIIAGFIGGFQFPLASKICLNDASRVGKTAGLLYGMDLLGSCLGALLASAVLIPVLGIGQTCILVSFLNVVVLILLWVSHTRTKH
jgi:predicted membrane-bound spermidine synthase